MRKSEEEWSVQRKMIKEEENRVTTMDNERKRYETKNEEEKRSLIVRKPLQMMRTRQKTTQLKSRCNNAGSQRETEREMQSSQLQ